MIEASEIEHFAQDQFGDKRAVVVPSDLELPGAPLAIMVAVQNPRWCQVC